MTDATTIPSKPARPLTWLERMVPLPETRDLVVVGYFLLAARLLYMIEGQPSLLANAAFMIVVGLVVGTGGLGVIASFYFGGTKTGSDTMVAQTKTIAASAPVPVVPPAAPPEGQT